jgi:hypothetical protein
MSLGRLIPVVSAVVLTGGVALAQQPKKAPAPAPTPAAPAAGSAAAPAPAAGEGSGSAVAPIDDAPPADMEGTSEDPDAPRGDDATPVTTPTGPTAPAKKSGYPIEESQRPITLPQNMAEISLNPRFQVDPYIGGDTLRARYGITPQIQIGVNYVFVGVYDDPSTLNTDKVGAHAGKTAGLDVTVLVTNWLGVKAGVPIYFDPIAVSFAAGAPMKFIFNKFALGAFDDVLNIRISKFAPRYDYEAYNHAASVGVDNNTTQSRGYLRFAGYGIYQHKPNLALIGRIGIDASLGAGGGAGPGTSAVDETLTFLRAGVQFTPKKWLDVGALAGFDDLSRAGSFGLTAILAVRI